MRIWRSLKALGCAVLRDGVYLLPAGEEAEQALAAQEQETLEAGGNAHLVRVEGTREEQDGLFRGLFDRSADYARLAGEIARVRESGTAKQLHGLRREFNAIAAIDFFPGEAKRQTEAALVALGCFLSGNEPQGARGDVQRRNPEDFQAKLWATRKNLWVDRMASAWLIRRFIDPQARFLWLERPQDCPAEAVGFDFDGAAFTHIGSRVTFEVLAAGFGLADDPALARISAMVHYLDVGGVPVPEAAGLELVLEGLRQRFQGDDALLDETGRIFDSLYAGLRE